MKKTRLNAGGVGRGPSQAALAREMQIDVGTLSRWERDMSTPSEAHMLLWTIKVGEDEAVAMARLRGEAIDSPTDSRDAAATAITIGGDAARIILAIAKAKGISTQAAADLVSMEAAERHLPSDLPVEDRRKEELAEALPASPRPAAPASANHAPKGQSAAAERQERNRPVSNSHA